MAAFGASATSAPATLDTHTSTLNPPIRGGEREREAIDRDNRLHSPFDIHAPIQWAI